MLDKKKTIAVLINILIAAVHFFRIGTYLQGEWRNYYYAYFSDVVLPFGIYFLILPLEEKHEMFKNRMNKAILIFSGAAISEVLQGFGIYFLGKTFDLFDFAAYAVGVSMAFILDKMIFGSRANNN